MSVNENNIKESKTKTNALALYFLLEQKSGMALDSLLNKYHLKLICLARHTIVINNGEKNATTLNDNCIKKRPIIIIYKFALLLTHLALL